MRLGRLFKTRSKAVELAGDSANNPALASGQATRTEGFFRNPPAGPASVTPFQIGTHQAAPSIDLQALIVPETVNSPTAQLDVSEILTRAQALQKAGRHDEAKSFYGHVLSREPRNADALHGLGMLAIDQGDVLQAESLISAAINLDPKKASYHSNFGHLLRLRGEIQAAARGAEARQGV